MSRATRPSGPSLRSNAPYEVLLETPGSPGCATTAAQRIGSPEVARVARRAGATRALATPS